MCRRTGWSTTAAWGDADGILPRHAGPGTDFNAVGNDRVSVTPLRLDLTHHAQLPLARQWLSK